MTPDDIQALAETLRGHDILYYELGTSTISDADYDALTRQWFLATGTKHYGQARDLGNVPHSRLMGTLEKSLTTEDVQAFYKNVDANAYAVLMPKIDGLALELVYDAAGHFHQGLSRGRRVGGQSFGEDVTATVAKMIGASRSLVVRGVVSSPAVVENLPVVERPVGVIPAQLFNRYGSPQIAVIVPRGPTADGKTIAERAEEIRKTMHSSTGIVIEEPSSITIESKPVTVRGEVYLPKAALAVANEMRAADGEKAFDNCRNAAAGIFRKGDPRYLKLLRFVAYTAFSAVDKFEDDRSFTTFRDQLHWLTSVGFEVPPTNFWTLSEVTDGVLVTVAGGWVLAYDTDGVVVTLDGMAVQRQLGYAREYPRFSLAFKFADETVNVEVVGYEWATSKLGKLKPRFKLVPTALGGAVIEFATGHNLRELRRLNAVPGDIVALKRAGCIIPQVVALIKKVSHAAFGMDSTHVPTHCPSCGGPTTEDEVDLLCEATNCPARLSGLIEAACGKKNLDVDGVGESVCEALVASGIINDLADFLGLVDKPECSYVKMLAEMELGDKGVTFGVKRAKSLVDGIENARKTKPWAQVLHALGCPGLGEPECKGLAAGYSLMDLVRWATLRPDEDIPDPKVAFIQSVTQLKGMGTKTAETLFTWLNANEGWLRLVPALGWRTEPEAQAPVGTALAGMTVVVTGVHAVSRDVIEQMVVDAGGTLSSAVSKKTNVLVAGAKAGSKLEAATRLGVRIIDLDGLRALIAEGG